MSRLNLVVRVLCVVFFFCLNQGVQASGLVTLEIEVLGGLKVSSPERLVFDPVAPGHTTTQDLNITVWSNVEWQLSVQAIDYYGAESCHGTIEIGGLGGWHMLSGESVVIQEGQPPTGSEGVALCTPLRFTGSYEDEPGKYSFKVGFTVVPSL